MTTHTPAPWHVTRYNDLQYSISNHEDGYEEQYINDTEDDANARLIAAAPELLAALENIDDYFQCTGEIDPESVLYGIMQDAHAAMAKAKGADA